ncbi:hypothetical protein LRS03_26215 [Rhizobacter sp. J219]|uniref:hypothetical protein n=1 Tax=Rhizobacter sp. J219 TaxID=2898430 RepID=UPI002150B1F6|nr:hypothetical protein [Rhizobacter sp. J219]MCR5886156.1 hypothetical protein [Rhizobacter sp. J219]
MSLGQAVGGPEAIALRARLVQRFRSQPLRALGGALRDCGLLRDAGAAPGRALAHPLNARFAHLFS